MLPQLWTTLQSITIWGKRGISGTPYFPHSHLKQLCILAFLPLGLSSPHPPAKIPIPTQGTSTTASENSYQKAWAVSPAQTSSVAHGCLQQYLSTISLSDVSPPKPYPSLLSAHGFLQLTSMSFLMLASLHGIPTPHPFYFSLPSQAIFSLWI